MTRMSYGASVQFHKGVLRLIADTGAELLHVDKLVPEYRRLVDLMAGVVNRQRALYSTYSLRQTDHERDLGVGHIKMAVHAALTSLVPAKRQAAKRLSPQLKSFRNIRRMERINATMQVDSMLALLTRADNAPHIAALALQADVEALHQANQAAHRSIDEKIAEFGKLRRQREVNSAKVMEQITAQYALIVQHANAVALLTPSAQVERFVGLMNAHCQNAALVVAHSGSALKKKAKAKEKKPHVPPKSVDQH